MSFNGSGTWIAPTGQPVVTGTVIQSSVFNTLVTDIANTFNNVLPRDGQAPMNAPLKIVDGTVTIPGLAFNSESASGLFRPLAGNVAITVSGVEVLRVNSGGRLLLGTTTDDGVNKLQVSGGAAISGGLAANTVSSTNTVSVGTNLSVGGTSTLTGLTTANNFQSSSSTITGGSVNNASVGATTPSTGSFTTLTASGAATLNNLASSSAAITGGSVNNASVGASTPSTGKFTTLQSTGAATLFSVSSGAATITGGSIDATPIGSTTASSGKFTTLQAAGNSTLAAVSATSISTALNQAAVVAQLSTAAGYSGFQIADQAASRKLELLYLGTGQGGAYGAPAGSAVINAASTSGLTISTNDTARMFFDGSGNVGFGVTPSAWGTLKAIEGTAGSLAFNGTVSTYLNQNIYFNGSAWIYKVGGPGTVLVQNNGQYNFYTVASGTAGGTASLNPIMVLDPNGNLLVGTTSAAWNAANRGLVEINGSSSALYGMKVNGTQAGYVYHDGANVTLMNSLSGSVNVGTNGLQRLTVDSSGNLLVGATSALISAAGRGDIEISGSSAAMLAFNIGGANKGYLYHAGAGGIQLYTNTGPLTLSTVGNTNALSISSSGNTTLTGSLNLVNIFATYSEAMRITNDGGYISFFNAANTTRNGYLQGNTGAGLSLTAESGAMNVNSTTAALNLQTNSINRLSISNAGVIQDAAGNELGYKGLPQNAQSAAYTLVTADKGKHVYQTGVAGILVNAGVFNVGDAVTIVNGTTSSIAVTQGTSVTLYQAGTTNSGTRTLAARGLCTILCVASNAFFVSGNVT